MAEKIESVEAFVGFAYALQEGFRGFVTARIGTVLREAQSAQHSRGWQQSNQPFREISHSRGYETMIDAVGPPRRGALISRRVMRVHSTGSRSMSDSLIQVAGSASPLRKALMEVSPLIDRVWVLVEDMSLAEHSGVLLCREFLDQAVPRELSSQPLLARSLPARLFMHSGSFATSYISSSGRLPNESCQKSIGGFFRARLEDLGLGGTAVAVEIAGFRIAGRPARRFVIAQIEQAALDDPAYRIAPVVGPPDVVTFLADEHVVALGVYLP